MRLPKPLVAAAAAAIATVAVSAPGTDILKGLSHDSLVWLRQSIFGPQFDRNTSPAVVIAIDEETYRREPFRSTPKVMWTNELAAVVDAVMAGGATVIGFDLILPTSVASRIDRFDRTFLQSLRRHSRDGRLVLSKVQHSLEPILPAPGQRVAVGHGQNIRATNFYSDADGIVRGVPIAFRLAGEGRDKRFEPSLASELARRTLGDRLSFDADGRLTRDGTPVPTVGNNNLLVNFDDNQSGIPTYSLADLHACAAADDSDFFHRQFADRIVLLGAVLDIEDRELSSMRYATAPDSAAFAERCRDEAVAGVLSDAIVRDSVPGVYVHAFAINNLVRGNFLRQPSPLTAAAAVFALALAAAVATLLFPATLAGLAIIGGAVAWIGLATVIFERGLALPLYQPPLAAALAFALLAAYRFTVANRDERRMRAMFGLYLAPAVIDRMVARGDMPALGGETRELSVYFSDLAGFTALSEGMTPEALVKLLNDYLSAMTEIVEAHGGFVDKYIGDAIVAVFGAPYEDRDHAANAVAAALACQGRLEALNDELGLPPAQRLQQRIGINTGRILVGNIGSRRRFNYTVMGDAVNLASRLEGANKAYGTRILVSEETMHRCGPDIYFREIDRVRVAGRDEPVRIYEPLSRSGEGGDRCSQRETYDAALAAYRAGDFDRAAEIWQALGGADPASAAMRRRARQFSECPPPAWDGVSDLDSK